ncbi:MAG TPA: hypothetical protein VEC35_09335 [Noviherbaspirillum sp.]|nr:hypothetical protein [Noviherbaspirillum sp.]
MQIRVWRLWEDGRLVPKWQRNRLKAAQGEFRLEEYRDEDMRRTMRIARLLVPSSRGVPLDVLTPLSDAVIVAIHGNRMTISGIERSTIFANVFQTWFAEILPEQAFADTDAVKP